MPRNLNSPPPKPPAHLGAHGRRLWRELVDEYRIADVGGLLLVGQAAEALDRLRSAQGIIREKGECTPNRYGGLVANPALAIERQARAALLKALTMLHLD